MSPVYVLLLQIIICRILLDIFSYLYITNWFYSTFKMINSLPCGISVIYITQYGTEKKKGMVKMQIICKQYLRFCFYANRTCWKSTCGIHMLYIFRFSELYQKDTSPSFSQIYHCHEQLFIFAKKETNAMQNFIYRMLRKWQTTTYGYRENGLILHISK